MVSRLSKICRFLDEKEPEKDKNFYVADLHGSDTYQEYTVPEGVRLILFCHARYLTMCERFETFAWEKIYLNEDASFNYCTFLSNLVLYPSFRDHFCVYNSGDVLSDLYLFSTEKDEFRTGVYKLPVKVAVQAPNDSRATSSASRAPTSGSQASQVFVSSEDIFQPVLEKTRGVQRVSVDLERTAYYARQPKSKVKFFSSAYSVPHLRLSDLVRLLKDRGKTDFTLLVMSCRVSKTPYRLTNAPRVYEELEKIYRGYEVRTCEARGYGIQEKNPHKRKKERQNADSETEGDTL